jgi:NAD+ kinase
LANVDLVIAVGGDGTVLSSAHFLDHGTIPLLGVNSDPNTGDDKDTKKKTDERRSHGALCMCTSQDMADGIAKVLYGGGIIKERARIQCIVKSTFSETKLVPALNDLLIANPCPAAVSRFRMGWLEKIDVSNHAPLKDGNSSSSSNNKIRTGSSADERDTLSYKQYGTVTRFGGIPYDVRHSLNVWSSGIWICTGTGSSAAMNAAGGKYMDPDSKQLQYLIREHMIEKTKTGELAKGMDNLFLRENDQIHLRWNSKEGKVFIDGSHLFHPLELGDEILINGKAPPLQLFVSN